MRSAFALLVGLHDLYLTLIGASCDDLFLLAVNIERAIQVNVTRAGSYKNINIPGFNDQFHILIQESKLRDRKCEPHLPGLTGFKLYFFKTNQLFHRTGDRCFTVEYVELDNLCPISFPSVL